ncbi:hypothetical protein [Streptomyces sp. NPDC051135]|uniref:hypothetical protein n=1 Tax=unclassified Streptomyces TaxID=2593676 RepID=UPI003436F7E4
MQAGPDAGTFTARDARGTARALFRATCRFHKPVHAGEWGQPVIEDDLEDVLDLVTRGRRG